LASLFATGFGLGYIPPAPGTLGSLAALPLAAGLVALGGWPALLAGTVVVTLVGIWACGVYARAKGLKDPGECVIDEVAGQFVTLLPLAASAAFFRALPLLFGLALFRFFDVLKPFPIGRFEHLPGGVGVMADDLAAGVVAAGLVWAALAWNLF
jgi:phosphatidylglycerophosphatase A